MSDRLPKQKKLVSISQAAKFLGVSIDTVRRWDNSGVLNSERPDGKNRYFSLDELEKHKSSQPLSISEAAKKLGISPTTLRRLEARGILKPERNNAGERVYDRDSLEEFLNSDYSLRQKQVKKIVQQAEQEEKELPAQPFEEMPLDSHLKLLQRIPELLASAVIFLLLVAIGVTNIQVSTIKGSQPTSSPSVFSGRTDPAQIEPEQTEVSTASTEVFEPKVTLTVKIDDGSSSVNIRQKPTTYSEKLGKAKDGDRFEFLSLDSDWYEVKLADGSNGFISENYLVKEEETTND